MLSQRLLRTSQVLVLVSIGVEGRIYDLRLLAMKGITLGLIQREGNALDMLLKQAEHDAHEGRFAEANNFVAVYESRIPDDFGVSWFLRKADPCDPQKALSSVLPG